jgi:cobalt-zinc-cadmium efflux system outer membrane protein
MAGGVVMWSASVRGQSNVPIQAEALAPAYVNAEAGITLDEAVRRALGQEPSLRASRTEADMARGVRLQAGLRPNPTVSFIQQQEPGGTDSQSRVELEWPLDLFRKTGRVAVADQELLVTEQAIADRERTLATDVRTKYGEVLGAVRELAVGDELLVTATRQRDLLGARVEQGGTPPLERDVVEVELRRLGAERLRQAARADRALIELKRLLGLEPTALLQLRYTLEQLVEREAMVSLTPADRALQTRPDVQEADARIRVAEAQIERARRDGRFDVSLFGLYMRTDSGFPQLGLSPQGGLTRVRGLFHDVGVGASLTMPLRNRNQGEVVSAQANRAGAAVRLEATQLTAQADIAAATIRDQRARDAVGILRYDARDLARQNLAVVTQTYELGRATVFDVLNEQRRFVDFERAYTAALREAYDARTALRRALGDVR